MAEPSPTVPDVQDRGSCQMATANLGQMTQVQTPTPTRKTAHPRDSTMAAEYASAPVHLAVRGHPPGTGPPRHRAIDDVTGPGSSVRFDARAVGTAKQDG